MRWPDTPSMQFFTAVEMQEGSNSDHVGRFHPSAQSHAVGWSHTPHLLLRGGYFAC